VDPRTVAGVDVMGPIIEFLTLHEEGDGAPCTMRGTIPPGVVVPLHSHPDPETYVGLSGEAEALAGSVAEPGRIVIRPGDVFHVPGGARHAFRNRTDAPAVMLVISTRPHRPVLPRRRHPRRARRGPAAALRRDHPPVPRHRPAVRLLERHAGGERPARAGPARAPLIPATPAPSGPSA